MYSVSIKDVRHSFGATEVLKGVSLDIASGEFFFLLGPSGCGKTTLLRILAGLERPKAGRVFFNNEEVTEKPTQARNTSLVFQSYALWPHMTVAENVAFGLENRKVPAAEAVAKVREALDLVRLTGLEKRLPGQLSGGQQQRVALARALVVGPGLLLLDEPLSNLDARLRAEMRVELMHVHRATRVTSVYVTHDQEEALSMADRIAFMEEGRILQVGTPRELYLRPATVRLGRFLGNANVVEGTVRGDRGAAVTVETALGTLSGRTDATGIAPGTKAHCFFRPENLKIVDGQNTNVLHGRVTAALFAGAAEHLYLENNGVAFQAFIPSPALPTETGKAMGFGIAEEDVRIIS
ncbi:MAG: ABC transporter ATP-binding protein [Fibrobacterota bacterium]